MTTVKISEIAEKIGNEPKEVTLPNGQTRMSVNWDAETAQDAVKEVLPLSGTGEKVVIDGPAPGWFVSALSHAAHPCPVGLNDPKIGVVDIPALKHGEHDPAGEIAFTVTEGKKFVKLEWEIDNGTTPPVYDAENLKNIVVPEIPEGKEVCISGRGPNYVTVAIGEAYAHTNAAVSYFQPQTQGYTVGITHTKERSIGDVIPKEEIELDLSGEKETEKERTEKGIVTVKLSEIAEKIGNEPKEITLPNGQTRMSVNWDAEMAQKAVKEIYPLSSTGEKVVIDGPAPGWFVSSLSHAVHPCRVGLNDPKLGVVDIPGLKRGEHNPAGEIAFTVTEGEKFVKLEWEIDNGTTPPVYDAENLKNIVLPEIPGGKEVCISGRGPNYVTVAIGEAYAHTNAAVSYFQPQTQGYTVGITHTKERSIGDVIPKDEIEKDILLAKAEKLAEAVKGNQEANMNKVSDILSKVNERRENIEQVVKDAVKKDNTVR